MKKTEIEKKKSMEDLKTFEDCCIATGRDPEAIQKIFDLIKMVVPKIVADSKLAIVIEAINKSIEPDWSNWNEWKYFPRFKVVKDKSKPSGFGLSYYDYFNSLTYTLVGSRLTFRSLEGLRYAWKQFPDLYEAVYL